MHYELYVDRLFVTWFFLYLLLLYLTAAVGRFRLVRWRAVCAAGAGSLFFLVVFILPLGSNGAVLAGKVFLQAAGTLLMLQGAFGFESCRACSRAGTVFGVCAVLTGGGLAALGKEQFVNTRQLLGAAAILTLIGVLMASGEQKKRRDRLYTVVIREGTHSIKLRALMDSGNSLRDPISHQAVCVVHKSVIRKLKLCEKPERFRAIPYRSVGKTHGILEGWIAEKLEICVEGQWRTRYRVILAESEELSVNEDYRMLLHPDILEEEKGDNHDFESSNAG